MLGEGSLGSLFEWYRADPTRYYKISPLMQCQVMLVVEVLGYAVGSWQLHMLVDMVIHNRKLLERSLVGSVSLYDRKIGSTCYPWTSCVADLEAVDLKKWLVLTDFTGNASLCRFLRLVPLCRLLSQPNRAEAPLSALVVVVLC